MKIRPLTGEVLVQLDGPQRFADIGELLMLPQRTPSPEENQQAARRPTMPPGVTGVVRAIGAWPKLPNGMALLPEYGVGARVVIGANAGLEMHQLGTRLKMVHQSQILAIISP
jgi:co-chaperonin GroES (HSP10)